MSFQTGRSCRRPTLAELQSIISVAGVGATMYTETDNQTGAFVDTTKFTTNGSILICKSGGVGWIVSPPSSEVNRTWYCRNDALLEAQRLTKTCCTQWFVPTVSQLQNPGYCCRTFWTLFSGACRWSSTEINATHACFVNGSYGAAVGTLKCATYCICVRAFRCVTY